MLNHELPRPVDPDPPRAGAYVPLNVHEWSFTQNDLVCTAKAVVPFQTANGFASIDGAVFPVTVVPPRVLTDQLYKMSDLYPETYQTMTECPEEYDTSGCSLANYMFSGCARLTSVPTLNLANCIAMGYMFQNCSSLISIQSLNTSLNSVFAGMFSGCSSLTTLGYMDTSNVGVDHVIHGLGFALMFNNCTSLPSTFPWAINVEGLAWATTTNADLGFAFGNMFQGSSVTEVTFSHASAAIRSVLANGAVLKSGGMTVHFVDNV